MERQSLDSLHKWTLKELRCFSSSISDDEAILANMIQNQLPESLCDSNCRIALAIGYRLERKYLLKTCCRVLTVLRIAYL